MHNSQQLTRTERSLIRTSASSRWKFPPLHLGVAFIFALILAGCVVPTIDVSNRQVIPAASVRKAAESILSNPSTSKERRVTLLDSGYFAYTKLELLSCLDNCKWIADLEYKPELFDWEEFALTTMVLVRAQLQGIAFGFGLRETGTAHAENLFIDQELNVWIVDIKRHGSELRPAANAFYFLVLI